MTMTIELQSSLQASHLQVLLVVAGGWTGAACWEVPVLAVAIGGGAGGLAGLAAAIGGVAAAAIAAGTDNNNNVTPPVNTNGQP